MSSQSYHRMPHPYSRYRLRLFGDFVRILLIPSALFAGLVRLEKIRLGWSTPSLYILWLFAVGLTRVKITQHLQARAARRAGGRLPTEVVGKWPGNIDILIKLGKAAKSRYPAAFQRELFEEYHSTTLNLRILWSDLVRMNPLTGMPGVDRIITDHHDGRVAYEVDPINRLQSLLARPEAERTHVRCSFRSN